MSVRKTDDFIADVERQHEWYLRNASSEIADAYLAAVEATCRLFGQHPLLAPQAGFTHPRLREWRFAVVFRPFKKHLLFYEVVGEDAVMRRAMHGHRDLPQRLIEPPGTE
jgi:plasmid stabilization system protein ParE